MSCHKTISLNDSHAAPPEEDRRPAEIEALSAEKPVNMTNQWYPFAKPDHFWMQWRFQVLQEMVSEYDLGKRLIEVGCGNCVMRDKWEGYLSLPVDACDLNRTCLEMAGPARGRLFLYDVLDRRPEWQEHFSSIFLFDTLEHIEDPIWFLRAIGYHTQPGGLLVINVPALPSLYSAYDGVQGHVKRYTRSILAGELEAGGYQILESRYWGFTMIPIVALRKAWGAVSSEEKAVVNGFQPSSRAVDRFLRSLMTAERALLRNPVAGTSLAAIARKV